MTLRLDLSREVELQHSLALQGGSNTVCQSALGYLLVVPLGNVIQGITNVATLPAAKSHKWPKSLDQVVPHGSTIT